MNEEQHQPGDDLDLVVVYRAPDEFTASLIKGILVSEDVPVILRSRQVPMYDGVMKMGEGYWGDVVVPRGYAERSRKLIEAYQTEQADK